MPTATITFASTRPGGAPARGEKIKIEHSTGVGFPGFTGTAEIIGTEEFHLDQDGTYSIDLDLCTGDMEGSVYVINGGGIRDYMIQPVVADTYSWADPAIAAVDGPNVQYVQGPPGDPAALPPDTLANRPSAAGLDDGITFTATDVDSGTPYVVSSGAWIQNGPGVATATAGTRLGSATQTTNSTVTITTGGTMYRCTALTTGSFTMPTNGAAFILSDVRWYESGTGDATKTSTMYMQVRYTTDNWSTSVPITSRTTGVAGTAIFYISQLTSIHGSIGASAGSTVQVAVFVTHADSGATVTVAGSSADDAQRVVPYLEVLAR